MTQLKKYISLLILFLSFSACQSQNKNTISVNEFEKALQKDKNAQIFDVRTAEEYKTGHLKNALQADWTNETEFKTRLSALNKNQTVYIYCLSGGRSANAMAFMTENGFKKVINLQGGITAWQNKHKPLEGTNNNIKQISFDDYKTKIPNNKTVLVDVGATWCPPCKKMLPIIETIEKESKNNYIVLKINGGEQTELITQLNINELPTFIIYKKGVEVWRKQGVVDIQTIKNELK